MNNATIFYNTFDQARGLHWLIVKVGLGLGIIHENFVICIPSLRRDYIGWCYGRAPHIEPDVRRHEEVHVRQRMHLGLIRFLVNYLLRPEHRLRMEMEAYVRQYVGVWYEAGYNWQLTVSDLPHGLVDLFHRHQIVYRYPRIPEFTEFRRAILSEMAKGEYVWPAQP